MSIPAPGGRLATLTVALLATLFAPTSRVGPDRRELAPPDGAKIGAMATPAAPLPELDASVQQAGADADWWQTVSERLATEEYHASITEGGLQAPNRAQNLRTRFGPRGIEVEPRVQGDAAPAWRFGWETAALGRSGRMVEAAPAVLQSEGARVTYARPGWSEWYENSAAGLEQGFTIDRRPSGEGPLRIAGKLGDGLEGKLVDGAVDLFDAHGARVLRYGKLEVQDASGRLLSSRLALEKRALAIEVDDRGAAYPLTVDPLLTSPSWTAESNQTAALFGNSVATAGDVNGDGFSDVIVGAYDYDNGQVAEGRAFVYHGSAAGLATTPAWTSESNQAGAYFGIQVATAGDVNGDGYFDVVIGAFNYDNGETDEGRAYVYHGSAGGLAATPAWFAEGNQTSAWFGISAATAGDIDGDGYSDVIIGADAYDNGQSGEGRAFLYRGSPGGLQANYAWTAESNDGDARFGVSVATAGDVNGDGYSDVIVGASRYFNGQLDEGRSFVYHGSAGGLAAIPAWTAESNQDNAEFGNSVATAGDVNGDGYSDVIVGAHYYSGGQGSEGAAFVYHGSAGGLSPAAAWSSEVNQEGALFGQSVSTAGDVNGDGYSDVIIGADWYVNGQTEEGRAFVFHGSSAGLAAFPSWTAESDQGFSHFGASVATAGDVNGDGFSDIIAGAYGYENGQSDEGRAFVYHGGSDGLAFWPYWFTNGGQTGAGWGWSVATAGDVNGDGYSDILAVAYAFDNGELDEGKVWAYYGSPAGVPLFPAWSAETNQVGAQITSAASAGDVNGDGYADVIFGSAKFDNGQSDEGRTWLYLGSPYGLSPAPSWTSESDQADAWFGYSAGGAGDVNGDGYADVIVGAPYYDNGQSSEGRAWLYQGSAGGLGPPAWAIEGDQNGAGLGFSVGTAGDVNADGYSDVLVSLPAYDQGQEDEGVVWVFHGSAGGLAPGPSRVVEADQAGASFGTAVATAGDVNGDGFSDAIVGATYFDGGQLNEGRAFVYHGGAGGLAALPAWTTEPDQDWATLGRAVASAGDVNGDGYSDVVVGAQAFDYTQTNEGKAWLYHGSPAGLGAPVWSTEGGQAYAGFGFSVATAGDVNGDGFSDVIVSAADYDYAFNGEGAVWIWLGNNGDGLHRIRQQLRAHELVPIDIFGQSDSETAFQLYALARTPAGRGKVRVQFEVKPAGTPFDGTGLLTTPLALTGFPTGDGSIATFIEAASGLAPGTMYHWRLRTVSDSPFFPRSPWLWHPGNAVTEGDVRTGGNPVGIADASPAPAANLVLGPSAPNPFSTQTHFAYTLPAAGRARLAVYDPQGRFVAEIVDEERRPGRYEATWDGRNASGEELPSGVYFLRLNLAGSHVATHKIVKAQ